MKLIIMGNSGSGKSTLAKHLAEARQVPCLDLDTIAWKADRPGEREEPAVASQRLAAFCTEHAAWVIEGCYATLLTEAATFASHLVFLNPGTGQCQANCRNRPWEPHKYPSQEAQDANLAMLLDWVATYETRQDEFSLTAHRQLFEAFAGTKHEWTHQNEPNRLAMELR